MAQSIDELREENAQKRQRILDRLAKLDQRDKQLKVMQQRDERKKETRRKIITGAAVGAAVRDGVVSGTLLAHILDKYVTKEKEREFMGLLPKEKLQEAGTLKARASSSSEKPGEGVDEDQAEFEAYVNEALGDYNETLEDDF